MRERFVILFIFCLLVPSSAAEAQFLRFSIEPINRTTVEHGFFSMGVGKVCATHGLNPLIVFPAVAVAKEIIYDNIIMGSRADLLDALFLILPGVLTLGHADRIDFTPSFNVSYQIKEQSVGTEFAIMQIWLTKRPKKLKLFVQNQFSWSSDKEFYWGVSLNVNFWKIFYTGAGVNITRIKGEGSIKGNAVFQPKIAIGVLLIK